MHDFSSPLELAFNLPRDVAPLPCGEDLELGRRVVATSSKGRPILVSSHNPIALSYGHKSASRERANVSVNWSTELMRHSPPPHFGFLTKSNVNMHL